MADEELKREVDAYVDEVWEDVVKDIDYLVQVESVEDLEHAEPGKPWGPAPYEALSRALEVAARLGLDAHDCDGYIGYADVPGESQKYLATIAHTDIVPLGTGWTFDPLRVTRKDGYLIGRGVLDDKGPFVLSLYAAHFFARRLAESGKRLPYTLRVLVGNNEETNMADVEWYLNHFPQPEFCFSPDADFPVICGEKGHVNITLTSGDILGPASRIVEFDGGTVTNAIPGVASVTVRTGAGELAPAQGIDVEPAGEGLVKLTAHGKGGHASLPAGTVNAIGMLVEYLLENGVYTAEERPFLQMERLVFATTDGSSLGIAAQDDAFDPLTAIGGTIRTQGARLVQTMDIRYPTSTTADVLLARMSTIAAAHKSTAEASHDLKPFYIAPTSEEIKTLVSTYDEFTGRDDQAFTIGGGTYARHFARAVAFGPHDPHVVDPEWVGPEHGPDEGIEEDTLKRALKIYIVTIARLMRLSY